ncbi:hypothetical protein VE01_06978 [Pseudogymnoascus verrucosus]|uniref:Auxiliary Activity family 9 catalytic domain-containing protein n=1 Tax=Pseudogymnoascus verrucosus TaxID=342668 RepID=A0A1B8GEF6_9PEZI|nr:uncharacterized protein VE01_06978 [Pseudogymnoascus verrucosus]OBT94208.1 hypothetical protein VE01_06978 [Pseudogymnoascus verrucosus]
MTFSSVAFAASAFALLSSVSAHGTVSGIVVNGKLNTGYSPSFQFSNPPPVVAGWSIPQDLDNGFVGPDKFQNNDIICHVGATNAGTSITVAAGSTVELQWTPWPESHKGPVIDYLASCNGACETVDKTALKFFKIGEEGLIDGSNAPGNWASDKLIANSNTWVATIPADIAPGNYVLRHEIIALHSAYDANGAQNYPQCINLVVTGSGTAKPAGVAGTELYKSTDAGILIDIYKTLTSYAIPGPALYNSGAAPAPVEGSSTAVAAPTTVDTPSTIAAPTTIAPTTTTGAPFPFSNSTVPAVPTTTTISPVVPDDSVDTPELPTITSAPVVVAPGQGDEEPVTRIVTVIPLPETTSACSAAATVTVTSAGATVTVAAPATTVTVTVTASAKPLPSGATFDDVVSWFTNGVKNAAGGRRRHARAVKL